jgi:hypothetical protein
VSFDFEDSTKQYVTATEKLNGKYSFESKDTVTKLIEIPLSKNDIQADDYIRVNLHGFFHEKDRVTYFNDMTYIRVAFYAKDNTLIRDRDFRLQPFIGNTDFNIWTSGQSEHWGEAFFFTKVPSRADTEGVMQVSVVNKTQRPFFIDDLRIELWR